MGKMLLADSGAVRREPAPPAQATPESCPPTRLQETFKWGLTLPISDLKDNQKQQRKHLKCFLDTPVRKFLREPR